MKINEILEKLEEGDFSQYTGRILASNLKDIVKKSGKKAAQPIEEQVIKIFYEALFKTSQSADYDMAKGIMACLRKTNLEEKVLKSKDKDGMTPLLWAVFQGREEIADLLLVHYPAQILDQDNHGMMALMWAAEKGHENVVALLLKRGCGFEQLRKKNKSGHTAFMLATINGHENVIKLLFQEDPTQVLEQNNSYRNTSKLASRSGHEVLSKVLEILGTCQKSLATSDRITK